MRAVADPDQPRPPLRVAIVQLGGMLGGAERWQLQVADATNRADLHVVALGDGDTADQWRRRAVPVRVVRDRSEARALPGLTVDVARELRRVRPDVVVAHGVRPALVTATAARWVGVPCVWVRHDDSFEGPLTDVIDRLTDGQIATNHWLLEGSSARHPAVLLPPRGPDPLPQAEARAALGLPARPARLVLGMGCRLAPNKGVDDAIRSLTYNVADGWTLVVAGIVDPSHPGELARLRSLAAELGVDDRVTIRTDISDLPRLVGGFDALALLTKPVPGERMTAEGFGMVALEAMTALVPVVAVPPVSERVADGGFAVAPAAPADVAVALGLLTDERTRGRMGRRARELALGHPDAVDVADGFARFLASTVHRPGAGITATVPVSVVTTVLNEADGVRELLDAIGPQLGPDDEVVVVDGGSSDGTQAAVKDAATRDPRIRLLVEPGAGISEGRNVAIRCAQHEVIAATDAGCDPVPGWLAWLRAAATDRPDAELWTGTYDVLAHNALERAMAVVGYPSLNELARPTIFTRTYGHLFGRSFDPSMCTGRSVAFTRTAWERVGGFPEDLATGEDVTFGRAIVASGGTAVLCRDALVTWEQRPSLRSTLRMYTAYGEGSGLSRDPRLLGRDLARVAAYGAAAVVAVSGGRSARMAGAAAFGAYLSLPLARALRGDEPVRTALRVPAMAAARDLAKAYGALRGLVRGAR